MLNPKSIIKVLCALSVWSFVVIGLVKLHSQHVIVDEYNPHAPLSGRLLLQKDNKMFLEATSTTTDKILPHEVLIDSRQGEWTLSLSPFASSSSTSFFFFSAIKLRCVFAIFFFHIHWVEAAVCGMRYRLFSRHRWWPCKFFSNIRGQEFPIVFAAFVWWWHSAARRT